MDTISFALEILQEKKDNIIAMPRTYRIDWENSVHHVMSRGIEKNRIFRSSRDYDDFIERLETCVGETGITVIAWALMPNHVHLLLKTRSTPMWKFMHKLLTGYAMYFNRVHDRVGHLFQNRYLSILVQSEVYLMKLIRYIHRNPLAANIVKDIEALGLYPWTSHYGVMNPGIYPWQNTSNFIKANIGNNTDDIRQYAVELLSEDSCTDNSCLERGTYVLGSEGVSALDSTEHHERECTSGIKILGSYDFATDVYKELQGHAMIPSRNRSEEHSMILSVLEYAARKWNLPVSILTSGRRLQRICRAREFICYCLTNVLSLRLLDSSRILNISASGVRNAAKRFSSDPMAEYFVRECFEYGEIDPK